MEFGLFTRFPWRQGLSHDEPFQEQLELTKATEELGYHNIWLGEEHFSHDSHYLYLASFYSDHCKCHSDGDYAAENRHGRSSLASRTPISYRRGGCHR